MKLKPAIAERPLRDFHLEPNRRGRYTGQLMNPVTGEFFTPPDRVKQSFVAECDINNILKQYKVTGMLTHVSAKAAQGQYQDLPDDVDFQTSLNTVKQGQEAFASLPSTLRTRFGNDPANFLLFMADPANQEEAIKLGLATDSRGNRPPPNNPPPAAAAADTPDPKPSS